MYLLRLVVTYFVGVFLAIGSPSTYLFAEISSTTLPTGGNVVSGNITISTPEVGKMNVDQTSNQGIINWNTFNVGSSASVHFNQPSVKSSILNNVLSGTSIIHGSIFSNGRLILVNPTGILTGPTSAIRAEGAILSTLKITNNNFLNNNFSFSTNSASSITTKGNINGEYVALISPEISNKGKITTNVATALAAGDDVRLSISDSNLLTVAVNPSKLKTSIKNEGNIKTQNGIVTLKTDVAQSVVDEIVKTDDAKAKGLVTENGVVKLVTNTGTIEAKDIKIDAGSKGSSEISGKLNSNSDTSNGGTIEVTAKDIDVNAATISADGKTGGGKVLIGGDWQGSGDLLQATYLNIDDATKISADALISGSGGTIVAWSNIKDENSLTKVSGTLSAKGIDGDGGQIETSGATLLYDNIKVNTSSKSGAYGNWLLDPTNLTIGSSEASTHASSLETTNVTLTADETITVNNTIAYTGSRNSTLTFDATTTVLNANITSSNGTLSVDINTILEAGASNTQITTNGGDVDISGVIRATGASKNLTIDAGAGNVTFSSAVTGVSSTTAGSAGFRRYNIDGYFNDYLDHFDGCETVSCGTVDYVIQEGDEGSTYSRRWTGVLEAEVSATYTFKTRSDDASYAFIGDKDQDLATFIAHIQDGSRYGNDRTSYRVVDNRGTHGQRDRTGTKALVTGGYYPIIVFFGENAGGAGVQFTFKGGGDNTYRYSNSANSNGKLNFYQSTATTNTFINNMTITASAFNAAAIEVGGTLSVTNSGTSAITGAITGDTALTKAGAGELTVSGSNTFTGDTTLSAGTLFGGADGGTKDSFGTGAVTVANGATLKIDDVTNGALTNALTLNGGTLYSTGDSTSYYDGNITLGDHSTFRNDNNLFIDGVISGSSKNLVKTGTGTLNLRGTNTYTGSTTISSGGLNISGSGKLGNGSYAGTISNSGSFTYASSATQTLSGVISGSGSLTADGNGALTLTGTNTFTGAVALTGGANLVAGSAAALGANAPSITSASTSDQFTVSDGVTLASLNITGAVRLNSGITSTGRQNYTSNVLVAAGTTGSPVEFTTTNSNINFRGTLKGEGNAKARSITINAGTGNVLFGDRVGYAFNGVTVDTTNTADSFYKMVVTGDEITIKGDVMTYEEQTYNGSILIGSTASNGTTRTLLSMDPKVVFNGTVNDTVSGKHTLIAKAVEIDRGSNATPIVDFKSTVGQTVALANYQGLTGYQATGANWGVINNSNPFGTATGTGQSMTGTTSSKNNDDAKKAQRGVQQFKKSFRSRNSRNMFEISSFRFGGKANSGSFSKNVDIIYGDSPEFGAPVKTSRGNPNRGGFGGGEGLFGRLFGNSSPDIGTGPSAPNDPNFKPGDFKAGSNNELNNSGPDRNIKELFRTFEGGEGKFFNPYASERPQIDGKNTPNNTQQDIGLEDEDI